MPSELRLATGPLRQVRMHIVEDLTGLAEQVGELAPGSGEPQHARMHRIAAALQERLRPHLEWEERTIHPIVDKYACEGPTAFSASMRYEHEIIYRWLADLRDLADGDAVAFARRADNLFGVILAHFELEEHVLFPILDRSMTPAAFRAHVGDPQHAR